MTNPHKYGTPEWMVARITEWIGVHGGEDSTSLTMYEAQQTIKRMQKELADAQQDHISALHLISRIREVVGDDGKRMQDELVTFIRDEWQGHISTIALLKATLKAERKEADAMREALTDAVRELDACQAVIHLAGGFDPAYVSGARAAIKKARAALLEKP